MYPLGEVFVEDETEDVVAKLIRAHLAAECIRNVPEFGLEFLFVVFGHRNWEIGSDSL